MTTAKKIIIINFLYKLLRDKIVIRRKVASR